MNAYHICTRRLRYSYRRSILYAYSGGNGATLYMRNAKSPRRTYRAVRSCLSGTKRKRSALYRWSCGARMPIACAHPLIHMVLFLRGAPVGAPSIRPYSNGHHPIRWRTLRVHYCGRNCIWKVLVLGHVKCGTHLAW